MNLTINEYSSSSTSAGRQVSGHDKKQLVTSLVNVRTAR